jgi:tRNA A37 threonylcarbamoyladenosine dehydratase
MSEEYWLERTELLLGKEKLEKLINSHVLVAGLGGVGGTAAEMIARAGVGKMTIIDADSVRPSNRNRQVLALKSTELEYKADLMEKRIRDINPDIELHVRKVFLKDDLIPEVLSDHYDYVVDAIDTLAPKIFLIKSVLDLNIPLISSMGAGGKMDPSKIQISDFSKTFNDKLARMLRKRMHKIGIRKGFKVVFSTELPNPESVIFVENEQNKKTTVGTISYMPPMFGSFMAAEVIRDLVK